MSAITTAPVERRVATTTRSPAASAARIPELDGLRGLMTLFVLVSHYFGEVPHGIGPLCIAWVAVDVFFVLSGYLVGTLIIRRMQAGNFLPVFYLRRFCRTVPTATLCCAVVLAGLALFAGTPWLDRGDPLPAWTYFAFVQNVAFVVRQSIGVHWLAPTWTLALEEQFYLVAPLLFLFMPRRWRLPVLAGSIAAGVLARGYSVTHTPLAFAPLALLPTSADVLCIGLLLAVVRDRQLIAWTRWSGVLRLAPIVCLVGTFAVQRLDAEPGGVWFLTGGHLLVSMAAAFFILTLVEGAPEAARFRGPTLRFLGDISYSVYLTHLAVLGLVHGILFHARPDLGSWAAFGATVLALPLALAVGWLVTVIVEHPLTAWGRQFRWQ